MPSEPGFLFITCQLGAEAAVKHEIARDWPALRFAYSRPGFLTFKLPPGHKLADDFELGSAFARAYGFSLGPAAASSPAERADLAWRLAAELPIERLHAWSRDTAPAGSRGYDPGPNAAAAEARDVLLAARATTPVGGKSAGARFRAEPVAAPGELVLDCVLLEPQQWWIGYHRATGLTSRYAGGFLPIEAPPHAVSRAYAKMAEALAWSGLPVRPAQRIVEIGAAPGGAAQALLDAGLVVTGIDPAEIHPHVMANSRFTHVRKRGAEVRRREFRGFRWLTADLNVAPQYTLDTVEAIVTHPEVDIRGLLLTLKLPEWELAEELPAYLARIQSWGYGTVRARQLAHNRQEVCVAATRSVRTAAARGQRARRAAKPSGPTIKKRASKAKRG
ncbi:MAG: SAM-dependent methyltransferase [Pirellulales bacterium]|nr:SAM-dependent methyltransferase [Pirellulales bacterium]